MFIEQQGSQLFLLREKNVLPGQTERKPLGKCLSNSLFQVHGFFQVQKIWNLFRI